MSHIYSELHFQHAVNRFQEDSEKLRQEKLQDFVEKLLIPAAEQDLDMRTT